MQVGTVIQFHLDALQYIEAMAEFAQHVRLSKPRHSTEIVESGYFGRLLRDVN